MSAFSFPPERRLSGKPAFDHVFQARCRVSSKIATLYYVSNSLTYARLGVMTAKRHQKTAVARNQLRRLVREKFRQQQPSLPAIDIVVVAHAGIKNRIKTEYATCVERLFKRLEAALGVAC